MRTSQIVCAALILAAIAGGSNISIANQRAVPAMAQQDQIWTQTWRVVQQGLNKALFELAEKSIYEELAPIGKVDPATSRLFIRYATSYGKPHFGPARVQYRYPHYNFKALEGDFALLLNSGLLVRASQPSLYQVSDAGEQMLQTYWALRVQRAQALPDSLKKPFAVIAKVLKTVASGALLMDGGTNTAAYTADTSVSWRRQSWIAQISSLDVITLAQEYYADYTAFNNDNAHYRFDRDPSLGTQTQSLGPIDKELFAAMRNGRTKTLEYCSSHTRWRQPITACKQAFERLLSAGLIEASNDAFQQSDLGATVFDKAQAIADARFYYPWAALSMDEYQRYKAAILAAQALLNAPPSSAP